MGLAQTVQQATRERPSVPKIAILAAPAKYRTSAGAVVSAADVDVLVRMVSMGRLHHTLPGTGAVALAVGCALPGSVPGRLAGRTAGQGSIRLGHPAGVMAVSAEVMADETPGSGGWFARRVTLGRTARRLMEGWVLVPRARA